MWSQDVLDDQLWFHQNLNCKTLMLPNKSIYNFTVGDDLCLMKITLQS